MYLYVVSSIFGLAYYFIVKVLNKRELQQTAINFSSDIVFKNFMKLYKKILLLHQIFLDVLEEICHFLKE